MRPHLGTAPLVRTITRDGARREAADLTQRRYRCGSRALVG